MMLRNEFWCVDIRKLTLYARIYEKWSRISHEIGQYEKPSSYSVAA